MNNKLKEFRIKKGLSRPELAALSGLTIDFIINCENNIRVPRINYMKQLAAVFDVEYTKIFPTKNKLLDYLVENDLTMETLSKKSQITRNTIGRIIQYKNYPSEYTINKLAKAINQPAHEIFYIF